MRHRQNRSCVHKVFFPIYTHKQTKCLDSEQCKERKKGKKHRFFKKRKPQVRSYYTIFTIFHDFNTTILQISQIRLNSHLLMAS